MPVENKNMRELYKTLKTVLGLAAASKRNEEITIPSPNQPARKSHLSTSAPHVQNGVYPTFPHSYA